MKDSAYLLRHINEFVHETMMEIAEQKLKKAKEICEAEIDRFYEEYEPMVYHRKNGLYNTYKLKITNEGQLIFELGEELMEKRHRVDNAYIYEKMFKEGWHGGADKGDYHPNPGKNYWRTPHEDDIEHGINAYSYWWSTPAKRSVSPYENIVFKWNLYLNGKGKEMELKTWGNMTKKYLERNNKKHG